MPNIIYNNDEFDFDAARNLMDDDMCDQIHGTVDTEQKFVDAYAERHLAKYGTEFVIN